MHGEAFRGRRRNYFSLGMTPPSLRPVRSRLRLKGYCYCRNRFVLGDLLFARAVLVVRPVNKKLAVVFVCLVFPK